MADALDELGEMIAAAQADAVLGHRLAVDELTVQATVSGLRRLITYLRDNAACGFTTLIDITGVDFPERDDRFDLVYHFLSMPQNQRIRVKVAVAEDEMVPSISDLFASADWYEREVFDMFGIMFSGHPDLRRILTDYGFRGHPLRKDFPTTGYVEVRYDETRKRVVYEPVTLVQEYRAFDFMSPWEGAEYILPGDEKNPETGKREV
ncbi:MAG TPA: NADH-quinone oxidoreductase subunit C [Paracoccaceae bacterium]|nr:NADH-quinone oxidoreductase subunit C [Paracoccaceae bacterium]